MRPRRSLSPGRERVGMESLQPRRSGAGQSHRQQDGCEYELRGPGRTSLRRGFPGWGFSRAASRILLAKAAAARHEGRAVDCVSIRPESWPVVSLVAHAANLAPSKKIEKIRRRT